MRMMVQSCLTVRRVYDVQYSNTVSLVSVRTSIRMTQANDCGLLQDTRFQPDEIVGCHSNTISGVTSVKGPSLISDLPTASDSLLPSQHNAICAPISNRILQQILASILIRPSDALRCSTHRRAARSAGEHQDGVLLNASSSPCGSTSSTVVKVLPRMPMRAQTGVLVHRRPRFRVQRIARHIRIVGRVVFVVLVGVPRCCDRE